MEDHDAWEMWKRDMYDPPHWYAWQEPHWTEWPSVNNRYAPLIIRCLIWICFTLVVFTLLAGALAGWG